MTLNNTKHNEGILNDHFVHTSLLPTVSGTILDKRAKEILHNPFGSV